MSNVARNRERELELHYLVTIRTYGKPRQVRRNAGKILARLVGLNFNNPDVRVGSVEGHKVSWSITDHESAMGEA